jgi:hypothetical protein
MVHRVVWTLPLAALGAVAADEVARRAHARRHAGVARGTWRADAATLLVALVLVVASVPLAARAMEARSSAERTAVALPADSELHGLLAAIRALPRDAVVAAAPELSERLPALTGRRVLAMSDRATIAFTGARAPAEARLRARAAIFGGLWKPSPEVFKPTHVIFEPGSPASRYCAETVFEAERFVLCTFGPSAPLPGIRMPDAFAGADGARRVALRDALAAPAGEHAAAVGATCAPSPLATGETLTWPRPGPWSAAFTAAACELRAHDSSLGPRTLIVQPLLGSAVEELTIQAVGERDGRLRWRVRTRARAHDRDTLRFALPHGAVDTVRVEVVPSFLPFLKLATLDVTVDDVPASDGGPAPSLPDSER